MPPLSAFARYTSTFVGATLLTSFAFQGALHKRVSTTEHDRLTARRTILESLVQKLRDGEDVSESEVVRLVRLAREGGEEGGGIEDTPWKEVVLGKRVKEIQEQKALEEWNAALVQGSVPEPAPQAFPVAPPMAPTSAPNQTSTQPAKKPVFL